MVLCGRWGEAQGEARGSYDSRVDMSVFQRPAGDWPLLPRRPLTPVETVPLHVAAGSLWKTPRPCLSDWPYGRQCHPGAPCCARHGCERSMAASPNSYIPVILFLVSPQCVLTQLHAVMPSILSCCFPLCTRSDTHSLYSHMRNTFSSFVSFLISNLSNYVIFFLMNTKIGPCN